MARSSSLRIRRRTSSGGRRVSVMGFDLAFVSGLGTFLFLSLYAGVREQLGCGAAHCRAGEFVIGDFWGGSGMYEGALCEGFACDWKDGDCVSLDDIAIRIAAACFSDIGRLDDGFTGLSIVLRSIFERVYCALLMSGNGNACGFQSGFTQSADFELSVNVFTFLAARLLAAHVELR